MEAEQDNRTRNERICQESRSFNSHEYRFVAGKTIRRLIMNEQIRRNNKPIYSSVCVLVAYLNR